MIVLASGALAAPVEFTDMAGRVVRLAGPPQRIVLGDGRLLSAFALVSRAPAAQVVGSTDNFRRYDPAMYRAYVARFPEITRIADLGPPSADLSPEGILSLAPDLVLLPLWLRDQRNIAETLQGAGIAVAYVDFFSDPLENLASAMRLVGAVLDRREEAEAFIAFHEVHMGLIAKRLAEARPKRPSVFLHARASDWDCCWSATGKVGKLIGFAGGDNIVQGLMASETGQVGLEFVLGADPDLYIAAASSEGGTAGAFPLGQSVEAASVRAALGAIGREPGLGALTAVSKGRSHALWLFFFQSPTYVIAVEAMAKWFHPALFADLNPAATLNEINSRFLAVPMQGTFFADACDGDQC